MYYHLKFRWLLKSVGIFPLISRGFGSHTSWECFYFISHITEVIRHHKTWCFFHFTLHLLPQLFQSKCQSSLASPWELWNCNVKTFWYWLKQPSLMLDHARQPFTHPHSCVVILTDFIGEHSIAIRKRKCFFNLFWKGK